MKGISIRSDIEFLTIIALNLDIFADQLFK